MANYNGRTCAHAAHILQSYLTIINVDTYTHGAHACVYVRNDRIVHCVGRVVVRLVASVVCVLASSLTLYADACDAVLMSVCSESTSCVSESSCC